ncbi:Glucose-methanol-choline oxidoreductase N-terminal [Trinorchestia longiramus]|nr:Glucose-methanol-choline oxidoreductase N-terminal [Trinorchestia longiramus]
MQAPPVSHDGGVREDEAGLHVSFVGYSMAGILALAAIWITVFSASPGILPQPNPVYDFIVVGSGTAGSVLAAKLANGTDFRVLLMEAGEEEPWVSKLPLSTLMLQGSKYDWKYYTETQEFSSYGMLNKKSYWPRGMMLGGCAQLNYNIFSLGWREHYDRSVCETWWEHYDRSVCGTRWEHYDRSVCGTWWEHYDRSVCGTWWEHYDRSVCDA